MKRFWIAPITILLVSGILVGCQGIPQLQRPPTPAATGEAAAQDGTAAATAAASGDTTAANDQAAASAQQDAAPQDSGTAQGEAPAAGSRVVADAKVVPVQSANLSMSAGGIVKQLTVQEGDTVANGQVLMKLDDAQQRVAVAQAQANLQSAQANLDELLAGARTQEIAQAEAGVVAAQAAYNRLANAGSPGSIAAAQATVAQAQASLQQVLEGPTEAQIIAATADLKNAEAQLRNATSAYNKIKDQNDVGMRPESLALEQATIAYEGAKARLADLQNGATPATIAAARAGVNQAQVQLDTAKKSAPMDLASAQAAVDQAQAQLDLVKAGARPEAIQIAEANVAAATASLQNALVALSDTELRAPFGGIIATINTAIGEQVSPGAPVINMADTSSWEIETSDLTEFDVVGIRPGNPVKLTFDAIPDLQLQGTVSRVRPIGEDNRGDTVYKVVVTPTENDPRLLWNMTAVVEFGGQ
ncbi:MAG: HlyD family efflux transporter periplasmic adaptor subunit [Caldilineaceae bacterium]